MKIMPYFLILLSVLSFHLNAAHVDIDLPNQFNDSAPIEGTIIISHTKDEKIDPSSFKLKKEPLQVEFVKEEPMTANGNLTLSIYKFKLPPQPKGLYILPEIAVAVSGKTYQSIPRSYEIKGDTTATNVNSMVNTQTNPPTNLEEKPIFFKLETFVFGSHELYPGQQIIVGYRYFYNTNVDTLKESVPLLEAEGLTKIGDKLITEKEHHGMSVQQIAQKLEAKEPGDYSFGPSFFEGSPYVIDRSGNKIYAKEKLSSTAPAVTLKVLPFPKENQPASFNGAIGDYQLAVQLISPNTAYAGDDLDLLVKIKGNGNFDSVRLPELCCQPGLSGLFSLNDLPSSGEVSGDTKQFKVKIRPLTPMVKEIPPFEFSFFNPETKTYKQLKSQPIPITVTALEKEQTPEPTPEPQNQAIEPIDNSVEPIASEGIYPLSANDLHNLLLGNWWTLFIVPLAIAALIFQRNLSKHLAKIQATPKVITSDDLFEEALTFPLGSAEQHDLISRAFLLKLYEKKAIAEDEINPEMLPETGIIGQVRSLLLNMERARYTNSKEDFEEKMLETAKKLFNQLNETGDFE